MFEALNDLAVWCGAAPAMSGGIAVSMLLAGVAASPLHCAPMCGGFVLGQVSDGMALLSGPRMTECRRLRTAGLVPYHLGRISTYAALGVIAGAGGGLFQRVAGFSGFFLLLAACLLALQASGRWRPGFSLPLTRAVRGYRLGVALGFLPCGVLYAALAAAAASGSPVMGGIAMVCFGLGTVPALVAVGLAGAASGHRFRRGVAMLTPAVLMFNAGVLALLGLRSLAGY